MKKVWFTENNKGKDRNRDVLRKEKNVFKKEKGASSAVSSNMLGQNLKAISSSILRRQITCIH
jgi:hypothetical protein